MGDCTCTLITFWFVTVRSHFFCECTCYFFVTATGSNHCVDFTLQLAKTGHPGLFKLWAMIGNDLHAIKVAVPRIFYVNQKTPKEGEGASKCTEKYSGLMTFMIQKTVLFRFWGY